MDENSNDNPTPQGTPQAASAQQPAAVTFASVEEFEAKVQERVNAAAAAARREAEAKLKPRTELIKPKASEAPNAQPTSAGDDRSFEDGLADALADHASLSREQRNLVRRMARQERPDDVDGYVSGLVRLFGPATATQPAPSTPAAAAPTVPTAPVPPVHAPLTTVSNDGPDDVVRWNESQWEAYVRRKGANPSNPYHWSNREVHQELARKYEASMATRRIVKK